MKHLNYIIRPLSVTLLAAVALTPLACSANSNPTTATTSATKVYTDPYSYCQAIGTIDKPNKQYGGPTMPSSIITGLQKEWKMPADTQDYMWQHNTFWRCMDHKVWACTVGANLPCMDKVNLTKTPTQGMRSYCKDNPDQNFIPAYVTGHNNAYEWACAKGKAVVTSQVVTPDAQGFNSAIWYQINPS